MKFFERYNYDDLWLVCKVFGWIAIESFVFDFNKFVVIVKSCSIHLIEDIWCDYADLCLVCKVFGWNGNESWMKNKKDNKSESKN